MSFSCARVLDMESRIDNSVQMLLASFVVDQKKKRHSFLFRHCNNDVLSVGI